MNMNTNCASDSAANLRVCENRSSHKSKESIRKPLKVKELFHRDLNKNILKLCSEADLRIKVLLSNNGSGVISSSSKLSSKETSSLLGTSTKISSFSNSTELSSLGTTPKTISLATTKHSTRRSSKHKSSNREDTSSSCHFNTEIDSSDDPTHKQLACLKILKLRNLARALDKRQNALIKNKFETVPFETSYTDGLEEGIRYGYFNNPKEELKMLTKKAGKTGDNTGMESPENKESKRMRGGFQDHQQKEMRIKEKFDQNVSSLANKKGSKIILEPLNEVKQSGVTITNEYPNKCDEDVNVEAFNQKYKINAKEEINRQKYEHEAGISAGNLNEVDRGDKYLQHFDKMLSSLGEDFAKGFKAGFGDGFVAANVFVSNDTTFTEDEKEYISQMRKCLKFSGVNLDNDIRKINSRAEEIKTSLNIPDDEFEEISHLVRKGLAKKIPLKFSKNDYKYYTDATKQDIEKLKIKSSYEDDSDVVLSNYEEPIDVPQHTKNRAKRYLAKHRINEFFQFLGSHLVATKPDDPINFLVHILDKCIDYRFNEYITPAPLLFTKKHVESVYFVLDPLGTGFIDLNQYVHGMEALGLRDLEDLKKFRTGEKIDKHLFITNACRCLLCKFRGMIAMDGVSVATSKNAYESN